jgi:pimeloyl-ACP methyl ester carboxylesterase
MLPRMKRIARAAGLGLLLLAVILALLARRDRPAADVEARHAQAPSRFVDVDGVRTHVRDRGQGPVVLLLHGSNASLFTWEGWAADLSRDHRVITVDLPGHGLTGPDPRGRYSASEMAEFVEQLTRALDLGRFVLGGNSMGGSVAWHYAVLHPERLDALILVDAGGLPREEAPPWVASLYRMPLVGRIARWVTPHRAIGRGLRDTYGDKSRVTEAQIDRYEDLLLREGNREATRQRLSSNGQDGLEARLGEIKVPTLILWGSADTWILPKYGERFHSAIAGSQLVVLDGLGHIPMEEDPARSVAPVRAFLAALPAAAPARATAH